MDNQINLIDALNYEIRASWWVGFIGNPFLQTLAGRYFAWKAQRKHGRYVNSLQIREEVERAKEAIKHYDWTPYGISEDRYVPICWDCSTPIQQVEVDGFDGYCTHCYSKRHPSVEATA
jgi:hypothetical protein